MFSRKVASELNPQIEILYAPALEFIASLHTYICRKSHKKIDLSASWAKDVQERLPTGLASALNELKVDDDWNWMLLLAFLYVDASENGSISDPRHQNDPESFIRWFDMMGTDGLTELFLRYSYPYPEDVQAFHSAMTQVLQGWNEHYFASTDSRIHPALLKEMTARREQLNFLPPDEVLDDATNGIMFRPREGLRRIVLVPQFHFQPLNIILQLDDTLVCHYAARLYFGNEEYMSTHELRVIRSLGEKNRLRILRFLHHGPRSFIEIVRHLGLSKGITHDHISKLRGAGLIYSHFEGENLIEYSIRRRALYKLIPSVHEYIERD